MQQRIDWGFMANLSEIVVLRKGDGDPFTFTVVVRDVGGSESQYEVSLSRATYERLTGGRHAPENCVEAAFRFLLDREPKEQILARFDIDVIPQYFPSFDKDYAAYLART